MAANPNSQYPLRREVANLRWKGEASFTIASRDEDKIVSGHTILHVDTEFFPRSSKSYLKDLPHEDPVHVAIYPRASSKFARTESEESNQGAMHYSPPTSNSKGSIRFDILMETSAFDFLVSGIHHQTPSERENNLFSISTDELPEEVEDRFILMVRECYVKLTLHSGQSPRP